MSKIIEFYNGSGTDHKGRSWAEIVSQTDEWFESTHDFIQWLFPLQEKSKFNKEAPLLTDSDIFEFQKNKLLKIRIRTTLLVMLTFYGLYIDFSQNKVSKEEWFVESKKIWISPNNHNYLRITRILKSLCLLGQRTLAEAFLEFLIELKKEFDTDISASNLEYWMEAIEQNGN